MRLHLKSYAEYEDSSVPWLGEMPKHWQVLRIKSIFHEMDQRSGDGKGILLSLTRKRGLLPQTEATNRLASAEDLSKYKVCKPRQLVMNRMQAWSGMFAVSSQEGLVSPDYSVFRANDTANVFYFEYLFKTPLYVDQFAQRSKGIGSGFNRLYTPDFGAIPLVVPPREEQDCIVGFLTHFDHRINRLIRTKQKMRTLLNEQKQAIIQRAVTRGLDPNVCVKPAGIEWLGDIPAHWETQAFMKCTIEKADYRGATPEKVDSGVFLVTAKNVRSGWIDYESSKEFVPAEKYQQIMRRGLPKKNDILFTTEAPLGNFALVDKEHIALAQRIIRFRLDENKVIPQFALYALLSPYFQTQLHLRTTGSTAGGIKASKLNQLLIVFPLIIEQQKIVQHLDAETQIVENAIRKIQREIDLIREYRTRLITDVVTGKLDVRGVEVPETQDEALLDEALEEMEDSPDIEEAA